MFVLAMTVLLMEQKPAWVIKGHRAMLLLMLLPVGTTFRFGEQQVKEADPSRDGDRGVWWVGLSYETVR